MDEWDDVRVALAVARAGTISGAADVLGVHHATVIRRIDALEARLNQRLFLRGARGYSLTDAGETLRDTAESVEDHLAQMASRIAGGSSISGRLTVTCLPDLHWIITPRLVPLLAQHPELRLDYQTGSRLFRLDTGEAHIAIRAAETPPQNPDYVVQPFLRLRVALYAAPDYAALPDWAANNFVCPGADEAGAPWSAWLRNNVPAERWIAQANEPAAQRALIGSGVGVGFVRSDLAVGLREIGHLPDWDTQLWLVTHMDLHRTPKVQAAIAALRQG
ncbi:MAG: LysR family transcriptional regulator [Paracoccus sp. (in: a-proteobacteria)]|nr:LysR family transcriptional regulator [Paracoccus sp. (in: a-proteobacteria)]MDO5646957.1 LysR family transcriptional regulator [Paracoccus sp. (in: a-proteobacteria)]